MPQIRLERVSKYYPQDKKQMAAVQEINLTVEQGEFLFLTGSSGAGKSTLLQLISGDLRPTSGAVFLDDINLTRLSRLRRDRLRLVFGRVPQLSQLMRKRTISENLSAVAMLTQSRKLPPIQTRIQKTLAMLVCARLRHVAGSQWGNKKYMNMKHLEAAIEDASIAG